MSQKFSTVIFTQPHFQKLADFQILMDIQTQGIQIKKQVVMKAIRYLDKNRHLGFFIVQLYQNQPVATIKMTFENQKIWWIQSVYVEKQYRRSGCYKALHYQAINIARKQKVQKFKLYVMSDNLQAKKTYEALGMYYTAEKFYLFDFVFGDTSIIQKLKNMKNEKQIRLKAAQNQISSTRNKVVDIMIGNKKMGSISYFKQYCQWRFAISFYIDLLTFTSPSFLTSPIINIINSLIYKHFLEICQISVGDIRYVFKENDERQDYIKLLEGGVVEMFQVMELDLGVRSKL